MSNRALIVEGGAMRGIFAAGVLDAFLEQNHNPYDFVVGVSAGASNLLGYLAQAPNRSYHIITQLATSKDFYNPRRFLAGGHLVDVKWLYEESNRQFPIDHHLVFNSVPFIAAATNVSNGLPDYYEVTHENIAKALEATASLPLAYKETPCFDEGCYTDGGVADSIPVREAYRRGARDITVILSHPLSYEMPKPKAGWLMKKMFVKHPNVGHALTKRSQNYNESLDFIKNPPNDCVIRVITPPEDFPVQRLTMKKELLDSGYQMGVDEGKKHVYHLRGEHVYQQDECPFC
ncbi:Patatin-like phospholipase [Vibrio thalassae]|uniref:Patatin-like phospholipase n=1 Tax=Vibrio thalassae TaxID=1243014 RepID=A0A240EN88_9VIBR|nr:patatin family protein [Vibrio thalassae]SNX49440.1 Patatin-like phospholipase [Vibrio thalassae]